MRIYVKRIIIACCSFLVLGSCGKDNYDAPGSTLSGKVSYQGKPIGVRGSNQSVYLQLWQDGFQFRSAINVYLTQDGSFSAQLFDGTYKMVSTSGNGPWGGTRDTLLVEVKGNTSIDYSVKPYYTLSNINYQVEGNLLKASFDIETIDNSRGIDGVVLLVNDTKFVDLGQYAAKIEKNDVTTSHVELALDVKDVLDKGTAVYGRVGLRISGITEAIYDSALYKLK
ncbi:DUF3823 domain-containing protein [Sphingobacterium sp. SRCM116780]|uniref:DUF3823 domain-containing protein n=1 Tax=Sphingobacterium sp. SRCM116780 TaxID=2907623 RepID=UPI001F1E59B6|nr:DUF3823 domain-containing protein [Sphingobacterium sp. SRCM116780]UIR54733.1 DUF3823 domain-containing protein [Sphingobacterium sp. SRCM116780]